ncbi:MAG: hypothetical protein Q9195_004033 [Heterodermia aff. obscurata]
MSGLLLPPTASFSRPKHGSKASAYAPPTPPSYDFIDKPESIAHAVDDLKVAAQVVKKKTVNLVRPVEPPVTYLEILNIFQLAAETPRLVTSGPHNRMTIRKIPESASRQYEEVEELDSFEKSEVVNCASNNYGGFSRLEFGSERVIEAALRQLPFCPPPAALEEQVRLKYASYMGFDGAFTAPSGFSTNVLAFGTVAGVARSQGRDLVFLMDRDCHNSMFTGAFYNKGAKVHKFDHNDLNDLDFKLRMYREQDPSAFICVAIEGIYSMEGSISPGPAILALNSGVGQSSQVIQAGVDGLEKYGIGPCSARWFYGSFDSFIDLERRLANLYPSLIMQSGLCRSMICGDAEVTIGSTLSAIAIPTASTKITNAVFVLDAAPHGVLSGVAVDKPNLRVIRNYYSSVCAIPEMLDLRKQTHLTFYFLTAQKDGSGILELVSLFRHSVFKTPQARENISSVTILLDDCNVLGKIGPRKLGYLDLMESRHGASFLTDALAVFGKTDKVRVMVAGSWYDAFGHQGGYVTGHVASVEALTWDAKAYFSSTAPMPLQACMTEQAIEMLQEEQGREER